MLVKAIMPIEYKVFNHKFIKFSDLNTYDSIEELIEKIKENQCILEEIYNLTSNNTNISSAIPLKIFKFFEKLREY